MSADCKYKEQVLKREFHGSANCKVFQAWKNNLFRFPTEPRVV